MIFIKSSWEVNFDSPQQLIPTDLAFITSTSIISILKLTRKHWSSLVPKKLTQPPLGLLDYISKKQIDKNVWKVRSRTFKCIFTERRKRYHTHVYAQRQNSFDNTRKKVHSTLCSTLALFSNPSPLACHQNIWALYVWTRAFQKKNCNNQLKCFPKDRVYPIKRDFYKLMNNSNFGIDSRNNIDNCTAKNFSPWILTILRSRQENIR